VWFGGRIDDKEEKFHEGKRPRPSDQPPDVPMGQALQQTPTTTRKIRVSGTTR
jgi:hypothetical protein